MTLYTGSFRPDPKDPDACLVCDSHRVFHDHGYCRPWDGLCRTGCGRAAMKPRSGGTLCRPCYTDRVPAIHRTATPAVHPEAMASNPCFCDRDGPHRKSECLVVQNG